MTLSTRSSSLALPSGLRTALSKSKNASGVRHLRGGRRRRRRRSRRGDRGSNNRRSDHSRRSGRSLHDESAIATLGCCRGSPVGVAPAVLARAVHPHERAVAVHPVVHAVAAVGSSHAGLRDSAACEGSGREQQRHLVQFLHGSPLEGKKPQPGGAKTTFKVPITKSVKFIVPHELTQSTIGT